ncbi:MAG: thioredoxin family protein [Bacillota bacterium]|nr:thioredoxin family protein [Bacillota bacterium]
MIEIKEGMNKEQYMALHNCEESRELVEKINEINLSREIQARLKSIKEKVNIVVFSEGYCPDCKVVVPYLVRMAELNENIHIKYFLRKGNEELLQNLSGETRIPTVVTFDYNMNPKGIFVEVPAELKAEMSGKGLEDIKKLISQYREGKYNDLVEKSLLDIII